MWNADFCNAKTAFPPFFIQVFRVVGEYISNDLTDLIALYII